MTSIITFINGLWVSLLVAYTLSGFGKNDLFLTTQENSKHKQTEIESTCISTTSGIDLEGSTGWWLKHGTVIVIISAYSQTSTGYMTEATESS